MENTTMPNAVRRLLIIFGALLLLSLLASGFSAVYVTLAAPQRATYVPTTIGFEGQLADSQGVPVADGNYSITFTLYNDDEGGTAVWSETQQTVNVKDGLYSVQLGAVTPFEADDFSGARWLAVKVGSDAEMTPRISVGAVPFALNAKYAQGLQNYPVADTAPQTDNALMWNGSNWAPQGMTFPDLAPVGSNASPNDLLANYRSGAILRWKANDTVEVSAGELMIDGKMRRNKPDQPTASGAVDVKFAGDAGDNGPNRGIDTGTAQSGTPYYIYAVADDAENTFDLIISADSTHPTGRMSYRKLGSFATEAGNTNVKKGSVVNLVLSDHFVPSARVNNTTAYTHPGNSVWATLNFNSERWDNDNIHNTASDTSRLTAKTPGIYLIFANIAWTNSEQHTGIRLRLNGSTVIANNQFESSAGTGSAPLSTFIVTAYTLAVDDYVEVQAFNTSPPNYWSVLATGNYSPEFGMVRLGD